jgi:hypothetical protein
MICQQAVDEMKHVISIDKEKLIESLKAERFKDTDGLYFGICLDLETMGVFEKGSNQNPYQAEIKLYQITSSFPPKSDFLFVWEFVDPDALQSKRVMSETLLEIKREARIEWAISNDVDFDYVEEHFRDPHWEHYETLQEIMDEWEAQLISEFEEFIKANLVHNIHSFGDKKIVYEIIYT